MSGGRVGMRVLVAGGLLWASVALADTPRELARQGNEHYDAGRFAEALHRYEQAGEQAARSVAELLHDRAAAHFKLGQFAAARELWGRAQDLKDAAFEARTRYNLGNCDYAEALTSLQQQPDPQEVLDLLTGASEQYRKALRLDPSLTDARANLELTHLLRRQIEQQMQQQPQQQQGEGGEQQEGEQEQQEQSQQDQESEEGEQDESSQGTPQTQPSEQDSQEQQQPEEQGEGQEPPRQAPSEEEGPEQEQNEQPSAMPETMPAEQQPGEEEPNPAQMTRAQAERLLQMVRDAEQARREMLARQRAARQKPVDRDW